MSPTPAATPPSPPHPSPPPTPNEAIPHYPPLDGLRGIAILLVLYFHTCWLFRDASPHLLAETLGRLGTLGWAGVDLFFVLSGFLITSILLNTKPPALTPKRYFTAFYARRTLRVFPLYFLFLAFFFSLPLLFPALATSPHLAPGLQHPAYLFLYATNLRVTLDNAWNLGIFDHLWSLAVEEHFYLRPLLVLVLDTRRLLKTSLFIILAAPILRFIFVNSGGYLGANAFTLCRIDSLAFGALAAIFHLNPTLPSPLPKVLRTLTLPALLPVLYFQLFPSPQSQPFLNTAGYSLLAISFTGLLLSSLTPTPTLLTRALSTPLLRTIGKTSYGTYLLQQPLTFWLLPTLTGTPGTQSPLLATHLAIPLLIALTAIAACCTTGFLTYHLLEKHLLRLKRFFPY